MKETKTTPADSERLLSGGTPQSNALCRLEPHLKALKRLRRGVPTDAQVERFAFAAARVVASTEPRAVGPAAVSGASRLRSSRLRLRLAATSAALVLVLCASAGVAYAADQAVPGDTLYDLDRALENIGLGDGGLQERLIEASQLVDRGRIQEGLTLAGEALAAASGESGPLRAAADALRTAVDPAFYDSSTQTPEAQGAAADKLRWLATAEPSAQAFVETVNDLANSISSHGQGATGDGPSGSATETVPGDGSDPDAPGSTGNKGGGNGPQR